MIVRHVLLRFAGAGLVTLLTFADAAAADLASQQGGSATVASAPAGSAEVIAVPNGTAGLPVAPAPVTMARIGIGSLPASAAPAPVGQGLPQAQLRGDAAPLVVAQSAKPPTPTPLARSSGWPQSLLVLLVLAAVPQVLGTLLFGVVSVGAALPRDRA